MQPAEKHPDKTHLKQHSQYLGNAAATFTLPPRVLIFKKRGSGREKEDVMTYGQGRIYKKVEVIGVSDKGFEAAIQKAISKAQESLDKLSWFEVQEIRGHIGKDGTVSEYQVVLKVAFELK